MRYSEDGHEKERPAGRIRAVVGLTLAGMLVVGVGISTVTFLTQTMAHTFPDDPPCCGGDESVNDTSYEQWQDRVTDR